MSVVMDRGWLVCGTTARPIHAATSPESLSGCFKETFFRVGKTRDFGRELRKENIFTLVGPSPSALLVYPPKVEVFTFTIICFSKIIK